MVPMPLPHFLVMLCAVILAAGMTVWFATHAGVPVVALALAALLAAGIVRLVSRVE